MVNNMASIAHYRNAAVSPKKARLMVDLVRGKTVEKALSILAFHKQKSAEMVKKTLQSAVANAENNEGVDVDGLVIDKIFVNEGPTLKRIRPRAKGRADRILKRTCHISVQVKESWENKSNG
jgi:large subunit ribosomal protein L22